ncbi:TetR family transcriptional regulator [Youngiibacter multivorans]|uniref:AcrR family transcriptional regulator n=1 Tax=Youngiibacter multivorans TaxID=937251 RepID=A0ABS4FZF3_9CLOT|nr:TetR family transcriptional regulator [Youngiibacter multivorans]MBP1917679.1 AcrR family transcriptional regulator [Youngiibacter multivorans]
MNKKELTGLLATKIVEKGSFYRTEVQAIADNAERDVGTVYMNFKNKEEILDYATSHNILG